MVADIFLTHFRLADSFGPLGIVVAYGAAVAVATLIALPISGAHISPAITLAAYVAKRLTVFDTLGYVVAQVAGGVAGGLLLRAVAPKDAFNFVSGGVPALGQGISVLRGSGIEVILSFFLALAFWAVVVDNRGSRAAAPFVMGGVVGLSGLGAFAFTGAAMNPVRWFGDAVAAGHFANWAVWVPGPLLGALLGSLAYEMIFLTDQASSRSFSPPTVASADDDDDEDEEEEVLVVVEGGGPAKTPPDSSKPS